MYDRDSQICDSEKSNFQRVGLVCDSAGVHIVLAAPGMFVSVGNAVTSGPVLQLVLQVNPQPPGPIRFDPLTGAGWMAGRGGGLPLTAVETG